MTLERGPKVTVPTLSKAPFQAMWLAWCANGLAAGLAWLLLDGNRIALWLFLAGLTSGAFADLCAARIRVLARRRARTNRSEVLLGLVIALLGISVVCVALGLAALVAGRLSLEQP